MSSQSEVLAKLMATPAGRRALSSKSLKFFDTYYCGMRAAEHRTRWLNLFADTRKKGLKSKKKARLLLLAPRDHGKTEVCISFATQQILLNRNIRILWICESLGQAKKRVRRVRELLMSIKSQTDWCQEPEAGCVPLKDSDSKWTETQLYVKRTLHSTDPTLEAVGSGGAVTGGHFDIIIGDDLEDNKTVYSDNNRARTRDWFKATVAPMLVRDGSFLIVGTRKHHDDLYSHLLESPTWTTVRDQAIITWPDDYKVHKHYDPVSDKDVVDFIEVIGQSKVLWQKERPVEYLLSEREEMTPLLFTREMQNDVQDDESAPVKWAWLEQARDKGALYPMGPDALKLLEGEITVVQGWDLALVTDAKKAQNSDRDFTVGITLAKDDKGNRVLLDIQRFRGVSEAQLYSRIEAMYRKWAAHTHVSGIAVERNNFGELHVIALQSNTDLPIKPHLTTGKNKADPWDGVPAVRSLFENGKFIFCSKGDDAKRKLDPLMKELWGLGSETHDDTVMALWITECLLRRGGFKYRMAFGGNEPEKPKTDEGNPQQTSRDTYKTNEKPYDPFWDGVMSQYLN
tara:strand:- start:5676 stop:7385 length:1710 start_codon:yes stop_codon:yes gene_type:complete